MKLKLTPDNIPMSISIPLNNGKTRHCIDVLGSKLLTGQINMANGKVCLIDLQADIMCAVSAGRKTTIEVEPAKNEKTTQGTTPLSGTTTSGGVAESKPQK